MSFIACHRNIRISGSPHCVSITDLAAGDPTPIRISDPTVAAALTEALSGLVAQHRYESQRWAVDPVGVAMCTHCGDVLDVNEDGHGERGDICPACQEVRCHTAITGIAFPDWLELVDPDERGGIDVAWCVAALRHVRRLARAHGVGPYNVVDGDLWDEVVAGANADTARVGGIECR